MADTNLMPVRPVPAPERIEIKWFIGTGRPPVFGHHEYGQMADALVGLTKLSRYHAPLLDTILTRHGY